MVKLIFVFLLSVQFLQCFEIQQEAGVQYYYPEDDNQNLDDYKKLFPNPSQEDIEETKQEMEEEREAYIQSLKPYDQELGPEYYEETKWIRNLRGIVFGVVEDQLKDADSSDDELDEYHFDMRLDQWGRRQEENARLENTELTKKRRDHKSRRETLALLKRAIDN